MMTRAYDFRWFAIGLALLMGLVMPPGAPAAGKSAAASGGPAQSRSAEEWFRKGALVSTYGNYPAAVGYFANAIALDPGHSGAWFSQGVAYGQMGRYAQALESIQRAMRLEPANGLFFYGRGRVHLLAGDRNAAVQDFKRAADLGDEDALAYLKRNPQ
ncbi:MAG: tetratricopeptide repeat protein [Desulfobacterales bacterium]|nr:tetratricopeptide repeat protein [Desulfobacterales bacterium]